MTKEMLKVMLDNVAKKESFMTNPPKATGFIMIRYDDAIDCLTSAYNMAIDDATEEVAKEEGIQWTYRILNPLKIKN